MLYILFKEMSKWRVRSDTFVGLWSCDNLELGVLLRRIFPGYSLTRGRGNAWLSLQLLVGVLRQVQVCAELVSKLVH